jgi:hypothetical protein
MSPEEFDNRLKSSFQDEYLPPKDQLWQNINQRLDANAKMPFWYWLVPVLIVVSAGIVWLGNSLSIDRISENPAIENTASTTDTTVTASTNDALAMDNTSPSTPKSDQNTENTDETNATSADDSNPAESDDSDKPSRVRQSRPYKNPVKASNPDKGGYASNDNSSGNNDNNSENNGEDNSSGNNSDNNSEPATNDNEDIAFRIHSYPRFSTRYDLGSFDLAPWLKTSFLKKSQSLDYQRSHSTYRANFDNADLESKWYLNLGVAAVSSMNTLKVYSDSIEYIHKDFWKNKEMVTHNGIGFQAHAMLNYHVDKRWVFEAGLSYTRRTEDIRMDETSYSVAFRDNPADSSIGRIVLYKDSLLIRARLIVPPDTIDTYYYGVHHFFATTKNRYNVYTVPFNFKYQQPLSPNTYFTFGLGGGISYLTGKNIKHLDMVRNNEFVQNSSTETKTKRYSLLTGSINTSMAVYTNFNDYGQVGLYASYQMYLRPWEVIPKQYSVKMSDLQFGVVFRKPLNWGK